jgi:hypothetical protein
MRSRTSETEPAAGAAADHPTDADLIRHLDGEPAMPGGRDATAHLRQCEACASRADLLHHRRQRLARLLADADAGVDVPRGPVAEELLARARRRRPPAARPALRAAALLLVAGALAAQPLVRRWVGQQWHRAASQAHRPAAALPAVAHQGSAGTAVAFEPGPGPFMIQFDARPDAGTLTIAGDSGTRASAERLGGANPDLLVMPHGLHVRNASGDTASYLVRVPRSVRRVYLRFGASPSPADLVVDVSRGERRVIRFDRR